jgi:hypothetical protein
MTVDNDATRANIWIRHDSSAAFDERCPDRVQVGPGAPVRSAQPTGEARREPTAGRATGADRGPTRLQRPAEAIRIAEEIHGGGIFASPTRALHSHPEAALAGRNRDDWSR